MGIEVAITRIDDNRIINWSQIAYGYISTNNKVTRVDLYFSGMSTDSDDYMTFTGEVAEEIIKRIPWLHDQR